MSESTDSPTASGAATEPALNTQLPDDPVAAAPSTEARDAADAGTTPAGTAGSDRSSPTAGPDDGGTHDDLALLEQEGEYAADYLEGLLDILDLGGDLDLDVEGRRAAIAIVGADLDVLVGDDGATLDALQDLTRLAVQQRSGSRSRLMLDVAGYRARRRVQLSDLGTSAAQR